MRSLFKFWVVPLMGVFSLAYTHTALAEECTTDSYEPNNTHGTAYAIETDTSLSGFACMFEDDYYAITLSSDSIVSITTSSIIPTGDLDLYLLSIDGSTVLESSLSETSNESISQFYVANAGTYYIKTVLAADSSSTGTGISYQLNLSISQASVCIDDNYEDNDSWNNTTNITQANDTLITDLKICPADEDWFRFDLLEHEQLTIIVDFDHNNGDLDISLKDLNNNVLATSDTIEDQEKIVYLPESTGTYKLQVKLFSENDDQLGNTYSLQTQTEMVNPCGEDEFDPNESLSTAQDILEKTYELISCDADWFRIEATEGKEINVSLSFSHISGDLDLTLYDRDGDSIASSATSNDNESLSYIATYTGTYYVEVALVSNLTEGNPYSLTYEQTEPVNSPSIEPTSEPTTEPSTEPSNETTSCQVIPLSELSLWLLLLPLCLPFHKEV